MEPVKVLLVDDEVDFLDLMQKRLAKRNIDIVVRDSGMAGLKVLEKETFDVLVLDVKMPGMNGIETLRLIREAGNDVEVIMLTGHADLNYVEQSQTMGIFDYLIKPVAIGELIEKIMDAWRKRHNSI